MEWRDGAALSEAEFLAAYRVEDYPRPSVACDMVVFTVGQTQADNYRQLPEQQLQVLLIQRGGHPFLGDWALPGGFVRPGETVGQTAARELREETGLERVYLEQLGVFSDPGRDPRAWVMSCAHMALVRRDRVAPQPGDDARQTAWFSLRCQPGEDGSFRLELEREGGEDRLWATVERPAGDTAGPEGYRLAGSGGLAFDHGRILAWALRRLQREVETSRLPFHLLPERFTLTQLQQVCETMLGRPLLKAAFRRKIAPLVEDTGEYAQRAGHRPARLYQRKEQEP